MLVTQKLARLVQSGRLDATLDHVLRNGRPLPLEVRSRLLDAGNLPIASLGLALQRVCELTYSPSEFGAELAGALSGALRAPRPTACAEPLFVMRAATESPDRPTPGAAAIALAALVAYREQCRRFPGSCPEALDEAMSHAISGALHVLFVAQARSLAGRSARERGILGDAIDAGLVLWQCNLSPALRSELARVINMPLFERAARAVGAERIVTHLAAPVSTAMNHEPRTLGRLSIASRSVDRRDPDVARPLSA